MSLLFTNNAVSTLAAGISDTDLSLTVQAADGALFPSPTGADSFLITLRDSSNNIEIVECTSRSGDALTIVRAQEGTTAKSYLSGDAVELSVTAGVLAQYRQGVGDGVTDTAINKALGLVDRHQIINCTAAVTITLADAATMAEGYQVTIKNQSLTDSVTIDRATGADTINGVASNLTIGPKTSVYLSVNQTEDGYISLHNNPLAAYPVGAIYMSVESDDPETLFGGSWTEIAGRFLVGVGTADSKTYTATQEGGQVDAIIPSHTHTASQAAHTHTYPYHVGSFTGIGTIPSGDAGGGQINPSTGSATPAITVDTATGGEAVTEKNLPPFYGVYMWRRTA